MVLEGRFGRNLKLDCWIFQWWRKLLWKLGTSFKIRSWTVIPTCRNKAPVIWTEWRLWMIWLMAGETFISCQWKLFVVSHTLQFHFSFWRVKERVKEMISGAICKQLYVWLNSAHAHVLTVRRSESKIMLLAGYRCKIVKTCLKWYTLLNSCL